MHFQYQMGKRFLPTLLSRSISIVVILPIAFLLHAPAAKAGFLEDFYNEAGAQTAMTPAGIYESQSLSLATGGSFVMKTPRKDFTPFTLDAPHLKAGCGGIDLFLGAFSVPSREEFVSFLRSIGTAMPGLAFQLALQGLSPDLNEQVTAFRDMIMELSGNFSDSCRAAEWIVNEGASAAGWLRTQQHLAQNNLRTTGAASDASDADRLTRTNGSKVLENVPERKDSSGAIVEASELNLTWALLKGGKLGEKLDQESLETMMTLLGTSLYVKTGSGENATIRTTDISGRDILWDLFGAIDRETLPNAKRLVCDEPQKCLNPAESTASPVNLVREIHSAAEKYRKSLVSRNRAEVTEKELTLLANISSLPLLSLIEASASSRIPAAGASLLKLYSEAAAYEGLTTALRGLAEDVRRLVAGSSARSANTRMAEHAKKLESRLALLLEELRGHEARLYEAMSRAQSYSAQAAHIERSVYGRSAIENAFREPCARRAPHGNPGSRGT